MKKKVSQNGIRKGINYEMADIYFLFSPNYSVLKQIVIHRLISNRGFLS